MNNISFLIFEPDMIQLDFSGIQLKRKQEEGKTLVYDVIRKKWLILTHEEHVRQYIIHYFIEFVKYPPGMISVERQITVGAMNKRFDIVVYSRDHKPWLLVECKAPETMITETTLHQLLNYQRTIQCNYWLLTNGHQTYCANACDLQNIIWMESLPVYDL